MGAHISPTCVASLLPFDGAQHNLLTLHWKKPRPRKVEQFVQGCWLGLEATMWIWCSLHTTDDHSSLLVHFSLGVFNEMDLNSKEKYRFPAHLSCQCWEEFGPHSARGEGTALCLHSLASSSLEPGAHSWTLRPELPAVNWKGGHLYWAFRPTCSCTEERIFFAS